MFAANEQIVTAYETLGMTPEEIAEDQGLELVAVKAALMQCSSAYRKATKVDDSLNFSDDELRMANQTIALLAGHSEDERVKLKAAIYIRDDKKGRFDVAKTMNNMNINILNFAEHMKKALAARDRSKGIVDVQSSIVSPKVLAAKVS